jgi:hypothetical protein
MLVALAKLCSLQQTTDAPTLKGRIVHHSGNKINNNLTKQRGKDEGRETARCGSSVVAPRKEIIGAVNCDL